MANYIVHSLTKERRLIQFTRILESLYCKVLAAVKQSDVSSFFEIELGVRQVDLHCIKSDEMGFFAYTFSLILIYFTKYPYSTQILFFFCSLIRCRCMRQHKLKFWTGIRPKIRCRMVLVVMDS